MTTLAAFALPPATALVGDRLNRLLLGKRFASQFGMGARFALGLAVGMLIFSQAILLAVLAGFNAAGLLAWTAAIWGLFEFVLLVTGSIKGRSGLKFQPRHLWLLLLLPVVYFSWIIGGLSVLDGTLEFDAAAFWVFKAKILYLVQGKEFIQWIHQPNLSYAHWDYPLLVPGVYTLGYGLMGQVDEFVNKVWPFWMIIALSLAILSFGNFWKNPRPIPAAVVLLLCFLPGTLLYVRWEGGTLPMVFYAGLAALTVVKALTDREPLVLAATVPVLAACTVTKFEGMICAAVWLVLLVPVCWRSRGLIREYWKIVAIALGSLVPYALFRLAKPIPHFESGWWHSVIQSPGAALHRFPQVWWMNFSSGFFSHDFAQWTVGENGRLVWAGNWSGWGSFVNKDLAVLPWLTLLLLGLAFFKAGHRRAIILLTLAILGAFTLLAFSISCLPSMQADLARAIEFCTNVVGRYYYPFFLAWFLGLASLWFPQVSETKPKPAPVPPAPHKPPTKKSRR